MVTIDISIPRRVYLTGDTYAIKDSIRGIGGHWDGDRRAWWVSAAKREVAEKLAAGAVSQPRPITPETKLVGRVKYQGHTYYVTWAGQCRSGTERAHLISLDGAVDFWKDIQDVEWLRSYEDGMTVGRMTRFIADRKTAQEGGECPRCEAREAAGRQAAYYGSGDYDECPVCGATYREL